MVVGCDYLETEDNKTGEHQAERADTGTVPSQGVRCQHTQAYIQSTYLTLSIHHQERSRRG